VRPAPGLLDSPNSTRLGGLGGSAGINLKRDQRQMPNTTTSTLIALCAALSLATPGLAADTTKVSHGTTVTGKVTVQKVDVPTRHLTVKTAAGEVTTLKAPESLTNFANLKPGDVINATYERETEIVLSPPNKPLPQDAETLVAARAAKGELPKGAAAAKLTVSGAVVSVDKTNNKIKLVSPQGGQVHEFDVTSTDGKKMLQTIKPGDKITAYITESLLISTTRG
jgi:hypothetical protein